MSKKIINAPFGLAAGLLGKKKKKASAATEPVDGQPVISALTPEETRQRKLLRGKPAIGLGSSFLGAGTPLSGTLGG